MRYSIDGLWDMHRHILQHARFALVETRVDVRFGIVLPPDPRKEGDVMALPPLTGNFTAEDTLEIPHALPSVKELAVIVDSYSARTDREHLLLRLTPHLDNEDVSDDGFEIGSSYTTTPTLVAARHLTTIFLGCDNGMQLAFGLFHGMLRARWDSDECALHTAKLFVHSEVGIVDARSGSLSMSDESNGAGR
ncbi:hypothetical protein R3P38DRAFT_2925786, partial [Favolaschia claudopus]